MAAREETINANVIQLDILMSRVCRLTYDIVLGLLVRKRVPNIEDILSRLNNGYWSNTFSKALGNAFRGMGSTRLRFLTLLPEVEKEIA